MARYLIIFLVLVGSTSASASREYYQAKYTTPTHWGVPGSSPNQACQNLCVYVATQGNSCQTAILRDDQTVTGSEPLYSQVGNCMMETPNYTYDFPSVVYIHRCDPDHHYDDLAAACVPDQVCEGDVNPVTGECGATCDPEVYISDDYPSLGLQEGDCGETDLSCDQANGMLVMDQNVSMLNLTTKNAGYKCVPDTGCANVTGKDRHDPTFDFCQEKKDQCDQEGGTYGAIGSDNDGGSRHVCLLNPGSGLPTCASGSFNYFENDGGDYGMVCGSGIPPNHICDATQHDCDGDGNVDDQDGDGVVDNGTSNVHTDGGGGQVVSIGDPNDPYSHLSLRPDTNVGYDPLDPAVEGAGDCDPTSQNYAECAGMLGGGLGGVDQSEIAGFEPEGTSQEAVQSFYDQLAAVPIVAAVQNVAVAFSGSGSCPAPSFSAFGSTFTFDYHCTLYASISGLLTVLFVAFWSLAGIRHIMSA